MTEKPILTERRWLALRALKANKVLHRRPFLAHELRVSSVRRSPDKLYPASGALLFSLEKAGWLRRIIIGDKGDGMPFRAGGVATAWEITEAGHEAIAACPDTFPGEPVYETGVADD